MLIFMPQASLWDKLFVSYWVLNKVAGGRVSKQYAEEKSRMQRAWSKEHGVFCPKDY